MIKITKKTLLFVAVSVIGIIAVFHLVLFFIPFPQLSDFLNRQYSTRFYDRNGDLLQILALEDGLRREWYNLEDLPAELVDIFISAEDKNFYRHGGIDFIAGIRAAIQNIQSKKTVSGASTITMQLARIIYPRSNNESRIKAKIREAWLSLLIEARLSKDSILELYLNSLPFGRQAEGVGSGLRTYFGITPTEATLAHFYALAVIPRTPTLYNPHQNPEAVYAQAVQISSDYSLDMTYDEWSAYIQTPSESAYPVKAPHFILHVTNEYKKQNLIIPPTLHVTLDNRLNESVTAILQRELHRYADFRLSDGSVFAVDHKTGEILLWIGNADFYDERRGQIDGVSIKNQAGSAMKPFLYAKAIEEGISPASVFADVPYEFGAENVYIPLNFNNRYNGPQTMRVSLASSLNVPAVYLLYRLGVNNYMHTLQELGFDSLANQIDSVGLSLALGSGEVTLFELVRAFSVFPSDGVLREPTFLLNDADTNTIAKSTSVFSVDTARIICDFLSDKNATSLGFGINNVFKTDYPSMFKTGTSNQFQDIVALGATSKYSVGCWMGNFSGDTVIGKTGSSIPAEIVRNIMDMLMQAEKNAGNTAEGFALPEHYEKHYVCALSAMLPTEVCPAVLKEFLPIGHGGYNSTHHQTCNWHYTENSKVTVRYPEEYQRWFSSQRNIAGNLQGNVIDEHNNTINTENLTLISPLNNSVFVYDPAVDSAFQQIRVDCIGGIGDEASLYMNNVLTETKKRPYIWYVPIYPGTHTLQVHDNAGEIASITIHVQGNVNTGHL